MAVPEPITRLEQYWAAILDKIKGGGSAPVLETLTVTANGTYTPEEGVDGFDEVEVNVPTPTPSLQSKSVTVTQNGTQNITPDSGYDGLSSVAVTTNVPGYTGYDAISGTLAAPFGSFSFDEISYAINYIVSHLGAYTAINYNASAIGAGVGNGAMNGSGTQIFANGAVVTSSASSAFMATWDENGLVSAYMEQNGTITDISQYASLITTTVYLPTEGGNT